MNDIIHSILNVVDRLNEAKIYWILRCTRADAISIDIAVPGQRWEIDFLSDGTIDIEIFRSDGSIFDDSKLSELFEQFSD
jgi:hypothetical protein